MLKIIRLFFYGILYTFLLKTVTKSVLVSGKIKHDYYPGDEVCHSYISDKIGRIHRDHCYTFYESKELKLNLTSSLKYCKKNFHESSTLVSITNAATNTFLCDLKKKSIGVWIALTTDDFIVWKWPDIEENSKKKKKKRSRTKRSGKNPKLGYQNWARNEPDNDGKCVEMWNNCEWNDVECYKVRNFFCVYKLYTCNNVLMNDSKKVCSGNGDCIFENACVCRNLCYFGDDCDKFKCKNITSISKHVCSGRGKCIECDTCQCTVQDYYGRNCEEKIYNAMFLINENMIQVSYEIPWGLLELDYKHEFYCTSILENSENIGSDLICEFVLSERTTVHLNIYSGDGNDYFNGENTTFLLIKPLTGGYDKLINLTVLSYDSSQNNSLLVNLLASILPTTLLTLIVCSCILCLIVCCIRVKTKNARMNKNDARHPEDYIDTIDKRESENTLAKIEINKSLFKIKYEQIKIRQSIGKGGFAVVYLGTWQANEVAFKCFQTKHLIAEKDDFTDFEKEVSIMASINHPNIVRFYGATIKPPRVGIILEFCKNGSLRCYITKARDTFVLLQRLSLLMGIASAMCYLHERNIIHRDLKCDNILVDERIVGKLTDFGISKFIANREATRTKSVGTSCYMAPEVCLGEKYNEKCDIFSFSIILWETIARDFRPYGSKCQFNISVKVASDPKFRPNLKPILLILKNTCKHHNIIIEMISKCWSRDVTERPNFKDVYNTLDNFIKNNEKYRIEKKKLKMKKYRKKNKEENEKEKEKKQ